MANYEKGTKQSLRYKKLELHELKDKVNYWMVYFEENNKRFRRFTKFLSKTTLDSAAVSALKELGKPVIEFNSLAQEVSRQRAQFAMNEPGFEISIADGFMFQDIPKDVLSQMEFLEGHVRHELSNKNNDMLQYRTFTNQTVGGYSAWEMKEEYASKRSAEKKLRLRCTYHPTMTGWDPTARLSHKGDGDYCFELVPMRVHDYEREFGKFTKNEKFYPKNLGDITWSYKNMTEQMVIVCYLYHKEKKRVKYIQLTDGQLMTKKEYDDFLIDWENKDMTEMPPIPTDVSKYETDEIIHRYVFSECGELEYEKTKLPMLPYIFVDGDSETLVNENLEFEQFTKPLIYHAEGAQKLKDLAGQTAAYEIQSWVQSPFMAPYECLQDLPTNYLENWKTPQKKSLLVYNSIHKGDSQSPLPQPIQIQKQQTPQILMELFLQLDVMIQHIMGSNDAQLTKEGPHMSGKSQMISMSRASATCKPYVVSNAAAMERAADFHLHWMQDNMINHRVAPIIDKEGKNDMRPINHPDNIDGNINLKFKADMFKIKVTPGNSVDAQKDLALQTMATNSKAFPAFGGLVNEYGLEVILNNTDIKDIDILKAKAPEYMEQVRAQKQAAMKNKPIDPETTKIKIKQMEIEQEERNQQRVAQYNAAQVAVKEQEADTKYIAAISKINQEETETAMEKEKIDAQNARTMVMEAAELHKINHEIRKDHHTIRMEEGEHKRAEEKHEKEMKAPEEIIEVKNESDEN